MSTNRVLQFLPSPRCCPECVRRRNHERALEALRIECDRVERLAGGILEFWLPRADEDDEDAEPDDRELSFIWRARVKSMPVHGAIFDTADVVRYALSELRRLGQIYLDAAECVEAGGVYFPPVGTLKHDDQGDDVPAEGGAD